MAREQLSEEPLDDHVRTAGQDSPTTALRPAGTVPRTAPVIDADVDNRINHTDREHTADRDEGRQGVHGHGHPAVSAGAGAVRVNDLELEFARGLLLDLIQPPAWHADALCREHRELTWFSPVGQPADAALAVCRRCLVVDECLAAALADPLCGGVWGGTTQRERRRLRQQRQQTDAGADDAAGAR